MVSGSAALATVTRLMGYPLHTGETLQGPAQVSD